jgi:hypothetical protein
MIWKNGRICMAFLIWTSVFLLNIILLLVYVKTEIIFKIHEDESSQGISLQIKSLFYKANHQYDYTSKYLNLLESFLVTTIEEHLADDVKAKSSYSSQALIDFLKGFPIRTIFELSRSDIILSRTAMRYTVIDKLEWISTVGSRDALYTALSTGLCWTLKGIAISALSSQCRLKNISLDVKPDFVNPAFFSRFSCILKMRMVHIISIVIYAIVIKVRWCINGFAARTARTAEPSH